MTIGIDIVDINRIGNILEKKREKFYKKIFTYDEVQYIDKKCHNKETVAGLFAAKEAISKVLGTGIGEIGWKDVEILHRLNGKPYLNLNEKLKSIMDRLNLRSIEVSISHERDYAIAFSVGHREEKDNFLNDIVMDQSLKNIISKRQVDTHKGNYGRALIIGGSSGMTGSVFLSSRACMRTGIGLTYSLVPQSLETIMSIKLTEEIIKTARDEGKGYFIEESLDEILRSTKDMNVIAIGPGMGNNTANTYILEEIIKNVEVPLVIDADGINAIAQDSDILMNSNGKIILTPHPGELSRLLGVSIEEIQKNRIFYSKYISEKYNIVMVLKGNQTIVSSKDDIYINNTGNSGMATAGSGDVLTGIITSFIGQGIDPFNASKLGVYIHGLGGDLVKHKKGEYGLIASDILETVPYIIESILNRG